MTAPRAYHERALALGLDPLAAAVGLVRAAEAPFTVYEREGEWSIGTGVLSEIIVYWDEIRYRTGSTWRGEPVGDDPLRALARVLADLPFAGWRAYGVVGFELGPRLAGLPGPVSGEPLVHLVVPAREVRLTAAGALLRAVDRAELDELARQLAAVAAEGATTAGTTMAAEEDGSAFADLEHGAARYEANVAQAVADIQAGRLRKMIMSRVVPVDGPVDLIATYERGRRGNTPARSFLLDLGGLRVGGFSPETVVEVAANGRVSTQPLAGTTARDGGAADDGAADRARRAALLADPKEIYEHAVSVQAAQEELRPLCRPGSLVVDEFMSVLDRGSVQHLASRVSGQLTPGHDAWDAMAAVFPSITASGIPKADALAAIRRYESQPRGVYSGAVLSVDADGSLDAALVLRSAYQQDGRTWLRAGAGIVDASRPERELEETREKLRSVSRFLVAAPNPSPSPDREDLRRLIADLIDEEPANVGDEDNLFELGLESIALIQAVGAWRRDGLAVTFGELAENPTLDGWSKILGNRAAAARSKATRGGTAPADPDAPVASAVSAASATSAGTSDEDGAGAGAGGEGDSAVDGEFPLALMQHAYWVGRDRGQPLGGVAAHLYTEFDGRDVDPDRLAAAIRRLVTRHEALRTRITDNGAQRVASESGWRGLTIHDLRALDQASARARLDTVRDALSHQMLDIEHGEVFSTALSLLPDGATRLHLDVDMVAADAVSYRVLLADLAQLYAHPEDTTSGGAVAPAPGYTYREYREQRATARRLAAEQARQAWQDRLPSLPGAPELPLASSAVASGDDIPTRVTRRHVWLARAAREELGRSAHRRGVTPAVAVATVFAEVIGGWSAQSRFVLNVPLFDREQVHPDIDRVVGDFTSSVLLEVDLTARVPFVERARRIQSRLHADAAHAAYSGVEVLRDAGRARGERLLAPIVFTSALGLGELFDPAVRTAFGRPEWIISQGPQVLLDAQVTEVDGGLLINWDVREDAFAPGVVDAMFAAFERLVRELAWDLPVDVLLDDTTRAVRARVGAVAGPRSTRLLHEGFFAHAARTPDAPALLGSPAATTTTTTADGPVAAGEALTYGQLAARARAVAGGLVARGVRPGDLVGVSLPKGSAQVVAVLGVLAAGGTYVPIGVEQPSARIARIVATAGLTVAITTADRADGSVWPTGVTSVTLTDLVGPTVDAAGGTERLVLAASQDQTRLDEPAYVLFTSGSTGEPKGVEVSHRAAMNTIDDLVERLGIGADDRTLAVSALDFDLSVFDLFAPLGAGGAVVLVDEAARREATRWVELVAAHGVTILNCVPAVLDLLLTTATATAATAATAAAGGGPSSAVGGLRAVLLGGDRVGVDLPGRLAALAPHARFLGLGGTTETAIHSTVCEVIGGVPVPEQWSSVPYGTPLRNVRLRVVDPLGRDCPDQVTGELWIGGDGVAAGYRGDPERTADRFLTHDGSRWYRTGDLARYLPDGTVEFLGRRDHQVKIRGFRVELGEVESALAAVPGVHAAVAAITGGTSGTSGSAAPGARSTASLGAAVVLDPRFSDTPDAAGGAQDEPVEVWLRGQVGGLLPPHMVPDRIVVVPALPLSANGKIDRTAAAALLGSAADGARPVTAPSSDLERVILLVWQDLLGDTCGVTDEFFTVGGDSVLATSVVTRLRDELDTSEVSVRMLFGTPTVAGLAAAMRTAERTPGRLDRVASIAWEIASLSDDEIELRLGDEADPVGDAA
ncbi:salicylate synthase [Frankia sp. Ag45/Mut15]|uniref:Phenyloxazoline synthase MbtB n=1 Tax=Frankia umida TaxID=573489 RepID=A0ABT0JVJ7_9ACTN|nr:salicylate synthase [Frankia umida]MCK9875558.1 salicylate synthase [Frankia umida]